MQGYEKQPSGAAKVDVELTQVDDPTCPSCGVAYHDHLGLIHTCAKLHVELENKRALEAFIAKLEAQIKVLRVAANKVIRHHDAGTLSESGDSVAIETLRQLCS